MAKSTGRGTTRRDRTDVAMCACGGAWFELRGADTTEHLPHGAICMDAGGKVTGYAGVPHCTDCGEPWEPGKSRFRVVE